VPLTYEDRSIEGRIRVLLGGNEAKLDVVAMVDIIDDRMLLKALRLKWYGLCPSCGNPGISSHYDNLRMRKAYFCKALRCGWSAIITDAEIVTAVHPDDELVRICRDEVTKGGG
jgi:hypothetical protein